MTAYYNELDAYAAQWLRHLIAAGHIAPGDVDERSIVDVQADDLRGYTQCHFFAGIGGWSLALRLGGWPDDRPVWTGSCPCQPFSAAGKGKAADDERHLWPAWFSLIRQLRPPVVFGEQVEAAIGWGWLDAVFADLEGEGYACGAAVLPACGVGAPHIRQRCWFVADASRSEWRPHDQYQQRQAGEREQGAGNLGRAGASRVSVANAAVTGRRAQPQRDARTDGRPAQEPGRLRDAGELGDAHEPGSQGWRLNLGEHADQRSPWAASDWLPCTDGKARPTQPGLQPLASGLSFKLGSGSALEGKSRVGMLRAYGNAIVPPLAAEFIRAFMEC